MEPRIQYDLPPENESNLYVTPMPTVRGDKAVLDVHSRTVSFDQRKSCGVPILHPYLRTSSSHPFVILEPGHGVL
jgi:hypothetical protein